VTLQTVVSLTIVIDDTWKGYNKDYATFILQASLMILTYDCHNMFIVQATGASGLYYKCFTIVIYYCNDSVQYYKTTITIVIADPSYF
jgi:hypothetical protein